MSFQKGNQYGARPRYKSPDEIRGKIDAYFEECKGKPLLDVNGEPILDRWGNPVIFGAKPPTVTGLALALGFKTRRALMIYQGKKEFTDLILEAKSRVEEYNEQQLYTRDGAKGAQFALTCNFGWKDVKEDEKSGPAVAIINDIPQGGAATVNVNTETAVFNPLQKPEDDANPGETETKTEVSDAGGGETG